MKRPPYSAAALSIQLVRDEDRRLEPLRAAFGKRILTTFLEGVNTMDRDEWIKHNGASLLGVLTLDERIGDALNYPEIHVSTLRRALAAAWDACNSARAAVAGRGTSPKKARGARRNGKLGGHAAGTPHRCPVCAAGYNSLTHAVTCKGIT